jgi:hypothetical protein
MRAWQASHITWNDPAVGGALRGGWEVRDVGPDGRDIILAGGFPSRVEAEEWMRTEARNRGAGRATNRWVIP